MLRRCERGWACHSESDRHAVAFESSPEADFLTKARCELLRIGASSADPFYLAADRLATTGAAAAGEREDVADAILRRPRCQTEQKRNFA